MKGVEEINEKIKSGDVVVYTAAGFKKMVRDREDVKDVDVVTTATCAIMSGTAAILSIPVAEGGAFERADKAWLNDVPAYPGPCPNERLGIVDLIVYGTSHSVSQPNYGAGNLFREIVEGKEIEIKVESDTKIHENKIRKDDLEFARMFTTRSCFKNYTAFVNTKDDEVKSIFSVTGMRGAFKEISVSGCGELNPLENDPLLRTIGVGTKILVNGATGYVIGEGTRSSPARRNLSVIADMNEMIPEFMGGFITSAGPECITSIAIPIPVLDEAILSNLKILDEDIKLPLVGVHDRIPFAEGNYARVWQGTGLEMEFDVDKCVECDECMVEKHCPTHAFSKSSGIDGKKCFNCGSCLSLCPEKAFKGDLGDIEINGKGIPITLRQSNRSRANEISDKLKEMIMNKEFLLRR
jgi:putative methanogenesis marker 16 metalloprotein